MFKCNRGYTDVQYVAMLGQYYSGAVYTTRATVTLMSK